MMIILPFVKRFSVSQMHDFDYSQFSNHFWRKTRVLLFQDFSQQSFFLESAAFNMKVTFGKFFT